MNNQEVVYLQQDYSNLPAGTPLVKTDRPGKARFAAALVGHPKEPDDWYLIQGTKVSVRIPLFQGLVGKHHPTAKEVVGPFVTHTVLFNLDKLGEGTSAHISLDKEMYDYPEVVIRVVVNTVQNRGQVIRDDLANMPPVLSIDGELLTREIIRERVAVMLTGGYLEDHLKPNCTVRLSSSSVKKGGV